MPALARAQSISRRAAHLGFEWPNIDPVWAKVDEEMRELKEAVASGNKTHTGEEFGDLLFTMVNIARFLDIESEEVLAQTIDRFTRRFHYIEAELRQANKEFAQSSIEEMDRYWDEAKKTRNSREVGEMSKPQTRIVFLDAATYGDMPLTEFTDTWNCTVHQVTNAAKPAPDSRATPSPSPIKSSSTKGF